MSVMQQFDLTGRVAIVTGASKGLGRVVAETLAEAGANLVIISRHADEIGAAAEAIAAAWGVEVEPVACDVSDRAACDQLVATTLARFGRLDILVNNAGTNIREPLLELQDESWDQVVAVNQTGLMYLTRAAAREMARAGGGRILNFGSVLSTVGGPRRSAYAATKGAVLQMTRSWAIDLAEHNITVNCICPGPFRTPLNESWMSNEETAAPVRNQTVLKRFAEPRELAGVVLLLCSDASSFMTGTAVYVDGGLTCT